MDLTFQEKSIWTSLITTIVLFSVYFFLAFRVILNDDISDGPEKGVIGVIFVGVVIVFVIIETIVHIVLALQTLPEDEDERSRLIGLKATRNGAVLLGVGTWMAFFCLAFTGFDPMLVAHLLLSSFILAEIVRFSSQLIYFRMGV